LSTYTRTTIKIGPFIRGGYKLHGAFAIDHHFEAETTHKLFGTHAPEIDANYLYFTKSNIITDFMADALQDLWLSL
jgi:hypothetical protein